MESLRQRFEQALLVGSMDAALRLIEDALAQQLQPVDVMQMLVAPALETIGRLWEAQRLNVAEEHLASRIAINALETLRRSSNRSNPLAARAVVACLTGEQHEIGARMVGDLLHLDGWDVDFLGANVPIDDLYGFVKGRAPRLLALSVANVDSAAAADALIEQVLRLEKAPWIAVGGRSRQLITQPVEINSNDLRYAVSRARELLSAEMEREEQDVTRDFFVTMGQRISRLRRERGLSQSELAQSAELDRTYLSGVERGKQNPSVGVLLRLAAALGVSIGDLLL